jgi:hypothetical protein
MIKLAPLGFCCIRMCGGKVNVHGFGGLKLLVKWGRRHANFTSDIGTGGAHVLVMELGCSNPQILIIY